MPKQIQNDTFFKRCVKYTKKYKCAHTGIHAAEQSFDLDSIPSWFLNLGKQGYNNLVQIIESEVPTNV